MTNPDDNALVEAHKKNCHCVQCMHDFQDWLKRRVTIRQQEANNAGR